MPTKQKMQTLKLPDYGDPWLNRLAMMLDTIAKMSQVEREATLAFINAKFP